MSVRDILDSSAWCLHKPSTDVNIPLSDETKTIIKNLKDTLQSAIGVFGLSANQLGYMKNIIVIRKPELSAMINPEIVIARAYKEEQYELCLSYPNKLYNILRAEYIVVRYYDEDGNKHIEDFYGIFSAAIQHAVDHLRGITIADRGILVDKELTKVLYNDAGIPYKEADDNQIKGKNPKRDVNTSAIDSLFKDILDELTKEDDDETNEEGEQI